MRLAVAFAALALVGHVGAAEAFEIGFDWEGLKLCNTGRANTVSNPRFVIKDVPAGTQSIIFKMVDLNNPRYNHGGGTVNVSQSGTLARGAFRYKSPCPPRGSNTYEWTATAKAGAGGRGKTLAVAKARRRYPE